MLWHLYKLVPQEQIALLYMHVDSLYLFATNKKLAESDNIKQILKEMQANLKVYLFYAYLLTIRDGIKQAQKVIVNLL